MVLNKLENKGFWSKKNFDKVSQFKVKIQLQYIFNLQTIIFIAHECSIILELLDFKLYTKKQLN